MHNMVQKKFGKKFDISKLGYTKLKVFLNEIEGVYFDHGDNINHIKARYKSPVKRKENKDFSPKEGEERESKRFLMKYSEKDREDSTIFSSKNFTINEKETVDEK